MWRACAGSARGAVVKLLSLEQGKGEAVLSLDKGEACPSITCRQALRPAEPRQIGMSLTEPSEINSL
ncbi:uncharacterized protein A4U43_C04F7770 [Asparagus officinalis]|uniref:Uncharacterized protein n=1 Tax=Asparagus officinalis TaxID=4686 RepID=A0A5P1F0W5_ASPOF|nr:uncharacterized protein A4U43_C04F7770 [Asparagus officinalis]